MAEDLIKIAIIEPVGGHGGMDYYDYGLAMGLAKNNSLVHFYTSDKTKIRNIENVLTHIIFKNVWNEKNIFIKLVRFLSAYFKAFKDSKSKNVKIVHLHFFDVGALNFIVLLISFLFKHKIVLTLHDVSSFRTGKSSFFQSLIFNGVSSIIVHNQSSMNELIKIYPQKEKINVIPHGNYIPYVNQIDYQPTDNNTFRILFFGQIKKVKGLDVLLDAMRILVENGNSVFLTIAGRPWHDDNDYEKMIDEYHLRNYVDCNFDFIPDSEVENYFKNSDLVVLPYKKIYQSGVVLLSMSYGRAVIASDLEPFKEIIRHGENGFLFEQGSAKDLAGKIMDLSVNKQKLVAARNEALNMIKDKYDWGKIGAETRKIYQNL
jgi:D-inositol-3-phosphate glycosyltransferase